MSLIGRRFGNYVAIELIGSGGMGAVYLAEHPQIGRRVAVKVLDERLAESPRVASRFIDEAKLITKIEHPNVIDIYDFGRTDDGLFYYVMELLRGRHLKAVMREHGRMKPEACLPYVEQICAALDAAHEQRVVHRDLKPENVFVIAQKTLSVKILDFGVAKLLERQQDEPHQTSAGLILGSPLYMAPEQAEGKPDLIGPQTDVYALGGILYHMLTGRPPFDADSTTVVLAKHVTEPPQPLTELGVAKTVSDVVLRCLAKGPQERYQSARQVYHAFAYAVAHAGPVIELKPRQRKTSSAVKLPDVRTGPGTSPGQRRAARSRPGSGSRPGTSPGQRRVSRSRSGTSPGQRRASRSRPGTDPTPARIAQPAASNDRQRPKRHRRPTGARPTGGLALHQDPAFTAAGAAITTLSDSVGQVSRQRSGRRRSSGMSWFVGALLLIGGGIAVYVMLHRPPDADETPIAASSPAAKVEPPPATTPPAPKPKKKFTLAVSSRRKRKGMSCWVRIDGGEEQEHPLPCKVEIPDGSEVALQVSRKGYEPFHKKLTMSGDQAFEVRMRRRGHRIVLADPPSKAKSDHHERRDRRRHKRDEDDAYDPSKHRKRKRVRVLMKKEGEPDLLRPKGDITVDPFKGSH